MRSEYLLLGVITLIVISCICRTCGNTKEDFRGHRRHRNRWGHRGHWGRRGRWRYYPRRIPWGYNYYYPRVYYPEQPWWWSVWPWGNYTYY